jgi:hypothetical protein
MASPFCILSRSTLLVLQQAAALIHSPDGDFDCTAPSIAAKRQSEQRRHSRAQKTHDHCQLLSNQRDAAEVCLANIWTWNLLYRSLPSRPFMPRWSADLGSKTRGRNPNPTLSRWWPENRPLITSPRSKRFRAVDGSGGKARRTYSSPETFYRLRGRQNATAQSGLSIVQHPLGSPWIHHSIRKPVSGFDFRRIPVVRFRTFQRSDKFHVDGATHLGSQSIQPMIGF